MKNKMTILLAGVLVIIFAGCNHAKIEIKSGTNVLSTNIEYDVPINNYISHKGEGLAANSNDWYISNLESSVRLAYVDMLFKKALSGKLSLTDLNDKAIDSNQIKKLLVDRIDTIQFRKNNDPNKSYDTIIYKMITPEKITSLRFRENWKYDIETMAITKEVLAIAPIFTPMMFDENYVEQYGNGRPLFWIKPAKEMGQTKLLTKRMVNGTDYFGSGGDNYNYDPKNFGPDGRAYIKNADTSAFAGYWDLFNKAIDSGKIVGYSYGNSDLPDVVMGAKEWDEFTISINQKPKAKLTGFRFLEEWSFDTKSMLISKKVVGLAPAYRVLDEKGLLKGYRIGAWVYFLDIWMPFDEKLELKKGK